MENKILVKAPTQNASNPNIEKTKVFKPLNFDSEGAN